MTTETEELSDLIREVVASYVDHGESIELEAKTHPGAVYWTLRGHAEDYGKLVGKHGAHFDALQTLIAGFGSARDELHVLNRLPEPERAHRRQPADVAPREHYDPRPARDLLCRILEELIGSQYAVEAQVKPNRDPRIPFPLVVTLTITVRTEDDYAALVAGERPLLAALGLLFRARANREGVGIQLDAVKP